MCDKKKKNKKKKEKNEETEPIFEVAYLGNARSDFAQIWNVECFSWRECPQQKIVLFHQGCTELRRCENCVFFLPVNILTGVTRRLLGPHDTLPCVLIYIYIICTFTDKIFKADLLHLFFFLSKRKKDRLKKSQSQP